MSAIEDIVEGYKRAIDKIRGPIAKNGFSGQNPARWPENGPPKPTEADDNPALPDVYNDDNDFAYIQSLSNML